MECFCFRLIGVFRMILQELVEVGSVKISDSLLDANNVVMKVSSLCYYRFVFCLSVTQDTVTDKNRFETIL